MAGAKHAKSDSFTSPLLWENTTTILQKYSRLYPEMNCFINKKFSNTVNEIKFQKSCHNYITC